MARQRKITADDILDATERVILRLGTGGLSIDAVAKEAGVSKSRVVYDHKSKSGLLAALMDRHHARKSGILRKLVDEQAESPNPELFGRIAEAECAPNDVERAVLMAVSAALPSEAELQAKVRDEYSKHAYPRTVHFVDSLPKTPSGKIQRFVLRGEARK